MEEKINNCITCKKNNKGDSWRNCRLKCHYKYEQMKKDEIYKLQEENEELKVRLQPFEDSYFNGLSSIEIAGLAKKSIRITTYNRQLETALEEIKAELKDDLTCESRECGCDDYGECLECLKETILNIITEVIGE